MCFHKSVIISFSCLVVMALHSVLAAPLFDGADGDFDREKSAVDSRRLGQASNFEMMDQVESSIDLLLEGRARPSLERTSVAEPKRSSHPSAAVPAGNPPRWEKPESGFTAKGQPDRSEEINLLVKRIQRAMADKRLFPPEDENAMSLAVMMLAKQPESEVAKDLIHRMITSHKVYTVTLLQDDRPLEALEAAIQLVDTIASYGQEEPSQSNDWVLSLQPESELWYRKMESRIIAGLILKGDQAVHRLHLNKAPDGLQPASVYIDKLISLLGKNHDGVTKIVEKSLNAYQRIIDESMAETRYDKSLEYIDSMEKFARLFGSSAMETTELRSLIETKWSEKNGHLDKLKRHDELLLYAGNWLRRGQLIAPPGANALEFLAKAIELDVRGTDSLKALEDLMAHNRRRIDPLIEAKRFQDASNELERLGAALERAGIGSLPQASQLREEVVQLRRQASEKQKRETKTEEPLTFINPF